MHSANLGITNQLQAKHKTYTAATERIQCVPYNYWYCNKGLCYANNGQPRGSPLQD